MQSIASIHVYLYDDHANVMVVKDTFPKPFDTKSGHLTFDIRSWSGEPDWAKIMQTIAFFNPEYIYISPRFGNADEFTSPEPTVVDCDVEYEARDTSRYQSGYRVYSNGSYREDFGSDM